MKNCVICNKPIADATNNPIAAIMDKDKPKGIPPLHNMPSCWGNYIKKLQEQIRDLGFEIEELVEKI